MELQPDGQGGAEEVWRWSLWDHTVQNYDSKKDNYTKDIGDRPDAYDINHCVCGGIAGARNRLVITGKGTPSNHAGKASYRGERDWLHANSVSYDSVRDQIAFSMNPGGEIIVIDHGTTTEEALGTTGGRRGKGGSILYRWGNPMVYNRGSYGSQMLFNQHSVNFLRNVPGDGRILVFNNGRSTHSYTFFISPFLKYLLLTIAESLIAIGLL